MEIHHAHAPAKEKHFRHYLFEFLMLFLAVTAGFFAENIREHIGDRAKEKGYMKSMIEDLKKDTANIVPDIKMNYESALASDSLAMLLNNYRAVDSINDKIYKLYILVSFYYIFSPAQRTLSQLKSSGTMRLIKNKLVADAIMDYENAIEYLKDYSDTYKKEIFKSFDLSQQLLNLNYYKFSLTKGERDEGPADSTMVINPVYRKKSLHLIDVNTAHLMKYANSLKVQEDISLDYSSVLKYFKNTEINLLKLIQKEYKL